MQPSVLKLEYQFSGRRFFDVCEASALRTALEWFGECQALISGEGVSSPLSPRRLRAKYTLRTNLRFMLRGFRPAGGKFAQAQIYSPTKPDCIYPCRPKDRRMDAVAANGYILGQICSNIYGTSQKSLCGCQKATAVNRPDTAWFAASRPVAAVHKKRRIIRNGKEEGIQVKRNSFIEMAKLHDLSGRITYISSHAKQEYLYEVYATEPDRAFWRELAKCIQEEFEKSGTNGKCIEARELMIALPETFINYDHDYLLKKMVDEFKEKYGVECFAALHHNKRKTNLHIHMIFAERKRLDQPIEKTATRNMFYDEQGRYVRTKKEILDGDGNIRKGCKIIKKGEVYERKIFTVKDKRFKQKAFLDEAKVFYTDLINQMALDDKDRLSIFDKNGPYLATKKIGKNNPKAAEIKADNEIRMEWNRTVDRAIVSGVAEAEILELKKTEITDKVKESVEQNGKKPELFGNIVRAAVALLEKLIAKVMQKVMDMAEKVVAKVVTIEEMPEESASHIQAEDKPPHQPEIKKIPFPFDHYRKAEKQNQTEQPQQKGVAADKKSVIEQTKAEKKSVSAETKQPETERPPKPQPSVLAAKYPRLKEIEDKLKDQNRAIFEREQKRDELKKELSECNAFGKCMGIFKGGRRKELQQEIDRADKQISNMKKHLSSIVREYKFDSVQAFNKELNAAKRENQNYETVSAEYEKTCGEKATDTKSVRNRLRQKEQVVKEREANRVYQARPKDKGAR